MKIVNNLAFKTFAFTLLILTLCTSSSFAQDLNYNSHDSTNYIGFSTSGDRLIIGDDQSDVSLFITNGGLVNVGTSIRVSNDSDSTNCLLKVEDGGFLLAGDTTNSGLTKASIIVGGTDKKGELNIAYNSEVQTEDLYVGRLTNETGSITVDSGGKLTVSDMVYVGATNTINNVVTLSAGGILQVENTNNIVINPGSDGSNLINVNEDGAVYVRGDVNATTFTTRSNLTFNTRSILGVGSDLTIDNNAIDNSITILLDNALSTNTSQWITSDIRVGEEARWNGLTLTNGAVARASGNAYVGDRETSSDNTLIVSGTGSVFSANTLFIGKTGDRNNLTITEGGLVTVKTNLTIGSSTKATQNNATITGNGSQLIVTNDLNVGKAGANNRLTIQDEATVDVLGSVYIGKSEGATGDTASPNPDPEETTGNLAIVGTNATLNTQNLIVGQRGGGSILSIRDGGSVNVSGDAIIGEEVGDNYIYLRRDSNTQFNVTGDLIVGIKGGSNRFAAYGGVANIGGDLFLGNSTNQHEHRNFIHVETSNAVINVANTLYIGASNSVNELDLVDGANVNVSNLSVGDYDGVSNNIVTVTGEDSLLYVTNVLKIGSDISTNNSVNIRNGGILFVGNNANNIQFGSGATSVTNKLNINDGGTLQTIDWNVATASTNIQFTPGSTLELGGSLIGTNYLDRDDFTIVLNDDLSSTSTAQWHTAFDDFVIGSTNDNNTLIITNGAMASTLADMYIGLNSANNTVTVGGTNSFVSVAQDLFVGTVSNSSRFNTLEVSDGGSVFVGNNMHLNRWATLDIDSKSMVTVTGNYSQDNAYNFFTREGTTLRLGVSSNSSPANLLVAGTADFDTGTTLEIYDDGIGNDTNVVQAVVQAGLLKIGGETATTALLNNLNINTNGVLLKFDIWISSNMTIFADNFITYTIANGIDVSGMLLDVANEIDTLAKNDDPQAVNLRNTLNGLSNSDTATQAMEDYFGQKQSSIPAHNTINLGFQQVAEQLTVRTDNIRERMAAAPAGAEGPHMSGQVFHGWMTGFGNKGELANADGFVGHDSSIRGFVMGADFSIAKNVLLGVAGGSSSGEIDKNNNASIDTQTSFGSVYTSVGTKDWFVDTSIIFGRSSIDALLGSAFNTTADYDANNIAFYLGGGKEYISDYLIFTPQVSVLMNQYKQDAYTEQSSVTARNVEEFDALYLQSSIGCNMGFYVGMGEMTLRPELRLHWLHEFNTDEEEIPYTLTGGTGNYTMLLQAPEEDILKLGVGCSVQTSEYLELRLDLDTRRSSNYDDYTVVGSLRYQF